MKNKVVLISLITGEVVMGNVISEDGELVLEKPMSLVMNPHAGGIGMIPYMAVYLGKELPEATFKESHIIYKTEDFMQDFKDKYNEYASGVITPEIVE